MKPSLRLMYNLLIFNLFADNLRHKIMPGGQLHSIGFIPTH